jgi:hypothetical protein
MNIYFIFNKSNALLRHITVLIFFIRISKKKIITNYNSMHLLSTPVQPLNEWKLIPHSNRQYSIPNYHWLRTQMPKTIRKVTSIHLLFVTFDFLFFNIDKKKNHTQINKILYLIISFVRLLMKKHIIKIQFLLVTIYKILT